MGPRPPDRALGASERGTAAGQRGDEAKYRKLRDEAYAEGRRTFATLAQEPLFRDFVTLYIAEGYKRDRNMVALGNSDPAVVAFAEGWLRRLSSGGRHYTLQFHADQDPSELCAFWGSVLGIDGSVIRVRRKSNSGQLAGRRWRSRYGVLTVWGGDTLLRARLQAWIDCTRDQWLSSGPTGV